MDHIAFITYHTCSRAMKEYVALMTHGHPTNILQKVVTDEEMLYRQVFACFYSDRNHLRAKLGAFKDATIFHVHNEPNWPILEVRDAYPDKPILLDCHDLQSQRDGNFGEFEKEAIEAADGYIFPSEPYLEGAVATHKIPETKPKTVIMSMVNEADIHMLERTQLPPLGGIAYEGGMIADIEEIKMQQNYNYRYYVEFAKQVVRHGIPLYLYGVKPMYFNQYIQTGAVCIQSLTYTNLLIQLSRHYWGFCGSMEKSSQWDKAMPNKLFEYIAAGLPIMVYQADTVADYVERNKIGVVLDKLSDIPEHFSKFMDIKENVLKFRKTLTMESQLPELLGLYEAVKGMK